MRKTGFTLIELMFVVGIIAIIAAIAIPNMLRARTEANEASAIGDLRIIGAAQITYNTTKEEFGGFDELTEDLNGPGTALLAEDWADGRTKNGYVFTMPVADTSSFVCFAAPAEAGATGNRYFRVDGSGLIRFSEDGPPLANDDPVGG